MTRSCDRFVPRITRRAAIFVAIAVSATASVAATVSGIGATSIQERMAAANAPQEQAPGDRTPPPAPTPPSDRTTPPAPTPPDRAAPTDPSVQTRSLFDGKSTKGWKVFVPEGQDGVGTFTVVDGVLVCTGEPAGYIATEELFESFELELEWRFDPTKGAGNSGVLLRVDTKDRVWPRSIEAQLHSGNAGDIWNIGDVPMKVDAARTEGRRTRKMQPSSEKPLGEWNRYRITLNGGKLELRVNGVLQNVAEECEISKGRIALQSEGAHIEFRNITIRPLSGKE